MKKKKTLGSVAFHLVCILFALTALYPIIWMLSSSLKDSSQVFVDAGNLIPWDFKIENYVKGWSGFGGISFSTFFSNTFFVVLLCVLGTVVICPLVAYGFARLNFKGKNLCFFTVLISLMLPGQIVMIPQYIMFNELGWLDTYLPLIVPTWFGTAFFIFQHMQFIRSIPAELDEAAYLDGAGKFTVYTRVILPLIRPSIATSVIFQFYWKWEDFFGPLIYLTSPKKYTVSVALKLFSDPSSMTDWGAMFAMSVASLIPPVLLFFFFQKNIVGGLSAGAVKG
ncbi:ABC transporter permease [Lachnoclostridium sp. An169]|uniref:carbohydrate ABC transporter permease n=1 Tax=Lachnoclostridium sp. An169 TaxID=1965569 RepID=UPI000B38FFE8|nr:carbohydrate ABC transporter permease [Lachnoclostridium sp. An169]OUP86129.1 ABC transporter permease [Lachnoclostridium sp. An169]HJA68239.1 carbohydrate ABC transporter permease [Candidatus Mediterraneibacter cottocaccae]